MQDKKHQLEQDLEQQTGSKLVKEYDKVVYCHLVYLTSMQCIMGNANLDDTQVGIKIAKRNVNNLIYAHNTTLMAESEEELKSPRIWLKTQHSKS